MAMISVVISDELREKLSEYKSELSISNICREALGEEAERFKRLDSVKKVPSAVIKKLKSEKLELSNRWARFGREDASKLFNDGKISYEVSHKLVYGKDLPKLLNDRFKKRYSMPSSVRHDYVKLLARGVFYVNYIRGFTTEIEELLKDIDEDIHK